MNVKQPPTPGVRFPPPVIFGVSLAIGFLLQRFFPVALLETFGNSPLRLIGGIFLILAASLALCAFLALQGVHTPIRPDRPVSSLVTHGVFRLSRNPLYLSLSLAHAGISLSANALWPLLSLLPVLLVIRYSVIAREESYLLERFGAEYEAYLHSVRRWI